MDIAAATPAAAPAYVWMTGPVPSAQKRMSPAAQEACDGLFDRKYAAFKNGRLPRSDDEIKALLVYFKIKFTQVSARLRKWRQLRNVALPALNLGLGENDEVRADIEERIGDGAELVTALFETLTHDPVMEEDPDFKDVLSWADGDDAAKSTLCSLLAQWVSLVLVHTASAFTAVGALELEFHQQRSKCRLVMADEFCGLFPGSFAVSVPKRRLFFWLAETRLFGIFADALRDDEHPALVVPAASPLPEADSHWLGPLLAYLAGWLLRQVDLALQSAACPLNKAFWVSWRSSNTVTESDAVGVPLSLIQYRSRGGLLIPSFPLYAFVSHVEQACMANLSEIALFVRGQTHVRKVWEAILVSSHIRASFVSTTKYARDMAVASGRRTEDDTTDLLSYIIEAWFRMRGPDFVVKIRKKLHISQHQKSVSLRAGLAAAAPRLEPRLEPNSARGGPPSAAEEADFKELDGLLGSEDMLNIIEEFEADCDTPLDREHETHLFADAAAQAASDASAEITANLNVAGGAAMSLDGIEPPAPAGAEEAPGDC